MVEKRARQNNSFLFAFQARVWLCRSLNCSSNGHRILYSVSMAVLPCLIYLLFAKFLISAVDVQQRFDLGVQPPPRPVSEDDELTNVPLQALHSDEMCLRGNTNIHMHTRTRTNIHKNTHTITQKQTHTHTHRNTHTHTHTHTQKHTHTHTHTYTHTHTHTHRHTHTEIHTHICGSTSNSSS